MLRECDVKTTTHFPKPLISRRQRELEAIIADNQHIRHHFRRVKVNIREHDMGLP